VRGRGGGLFGPTRFGGGRVQVFGCAPGCLIASLLVSLVLTLIVNLLIRAF
jgi:hypothetical protein